MPKAGVRPALMVYYRGPGGWLDKETKYKADAAADPALADFQIGEVRLFLQFWPTKHLIRLFDQEVSVETNNVVVVTGIGIPGSTPVVRAVAKFADIVPDGENPAVYVLDRSPEAKKALESSVEIPPGMAWHEVSEIMGSFLVPKGWHFSKASSSPYTYFITEKKYSGGGPFETGLKISVRKLPPDQPVLALAEKLVSDGCKDTVQVQQPFSESFGSMTVSGCIVRLTEDGKPVTVALTEIAGPKKNTLYTLTFQSPTPRWDKAWELGKYMMGHFTLDDDF